MIDFNQLNGWLRRSRKLSGLLGLVLDGSRLEGVVLRRTNGSVQLAQSFSIALSLDPLTADPELVGREIRNHLDAAEVRERQCVVGVPLKWTLIAHTEMPDLPEADVPGFLEIEAERGFHSDVETLHYATSRYRTRAGQQHVTLAGIPRNHVTRLEQVLRAAKLKPLSFSLGITALQPAAGEESDGVLALAIGETQVGLQITSGGGVAALRALEGALDVEGGRRVLHADVVARETRITLGQLPAELRERLRRIHIFGPRDLAQQLADELELRLEPMGLKIEVVKDYSGGEFGVELPPGVPVSPAFSLAASLLAGGKVPLEFLPPKIPAWKQLATKYSSGKVRLAVSASAAVLAIGLVLFLFQQYQLLKYQAQWDGMKPQVAELQVLQDRIQQYRPWADDSLRGLSILKQLTLAFPEDGAVVAKTVEIRDLNAVTCSGTARNIQALMLTQERLRSGSGVADVKLIQIRGHSPVQFTFDIHWHQGGQSAN